MLLVNVNVVNLEASGHIPLELGRIRAHREPDIHPSALVSTSFHRLWNTQFLNRLINPVGLCWAIRIAFTLQNTACFLGEVSFWARDNLRGQYTSAESIICPCLCPGQSLPDLPLAFYNQASKICSNSPSFFCE